MLGLFNKKKKIENDPILRQLREDIELISNIREDLRQLNADAEIQHRENEAFMSKYEKRLGLHWVGDHYEKV